MRLRLCPRLHLRRACTHACARARTGHLRGTQALEKGGRGGHAARARARAHAHARAATPAAHS